MDPPTVVIVMWEPVLYHQVGTAEVMRGQLTRLLELSERPGVLVHVVPSAFGANAGLGGPVSLAVITGKPDVLLTSSLLEDVVTSDATQAKMASHTFEVVRGVHRERVVGLHRVAALATPAVTAAARPGTGRSRVRENRFTARWGMSTDTHFPMSCPHGAPSIAI